MFELTTRLRTKGHHPGDGNHLPGVRKRLRGIAEWPQTKGNIIKPPRFAKFETYIF